VKKCPRKRCGGEMAYLEPQGKAPAEYYCRNCGYRVLAHYDCAVCGGALGFNNRNEVHNHYLDELSALFQKKGYKIITEGGIPESRRKEWGKPDIFVLKGLRIEKIIEVCVCDLKEGIEPRTVESKCRKIKGYFNPPELIVFEPTKFTNAYYNVENETKGAFKDYDAYNAHLQEKWKNEGLIVTFWNERSLEKLVNEITN